MIWCTHTILVISRARSFPLSCSHAPLIFLGLDFHSVVLCISIARLLISSCSISTLRNIEVGFEVYLRSIINTMEIVEKAKVKSLDPDELVGGEELGPNWCEAHVLVAIKKRERLVRPYGLFVTIEDAIGATIA